jgi:hypothetical protein
MQTGDQIESQSESFSAMPTAFAQDTKYLEPPNYVFDLDPFAFQFPIQLLFCLHELMQLTVFQRQNRLRCFGLQSPISQIGAQFQMFTKLCAAHLEQFVIVRFAFSEKRRNDLFRFLVNQNLRFQAVSLFLPL